jgi:hypothetical protein
MPVHVASADPVHRVSVAWEKKMRSSGILACNPRQQGKMAASLLLAENDLSWELAW